ncbi:hypothetical protein C471_07661 [Halorubrum saccharovorum DSM 1137]|uniref:Uncharacterized protein n=1 Tax=Halorubrum saccharovorum DSM 1137 TaxID=1227484 RepID=M0E117_9EURY|nr:hypothetical protein [Halorubrum saccharovorum]ELZ40642.1 hypothetical protein C471_07661 [Halorubrum saccharovorum DSM 1137]
MNASDVVVKPVSWTWTQVTGWASNVRNLVTDTSLDDILPPAVTEGVEWLAEQLPLAFGTGSPEDQIKASAVLAVASIITSVFSGGLTIGAVLVFALTGMIGALRFWPALDSAWGSLGDVRGSGGEKEWRRR